MDVFTTDRFKRLELEKGFCPACCLTRCTSTGFFFGAGIGAVGGYAQAVLAARKTQEKGVSRFISEKIFFGTYARSFGTAVAFAAGFHLFEYISLTHYKFSILAPTLASACGSAVGMLGWIYLYNTYEHRGGPKYTLHQIGRSVGRAALIGGIFGTIALPVIFTLVTTWKHEYGKICLPPICKKIAHGLGIL